MGLLDELRAAVGDANVLVDPAQRAGYETDWTGRFHGAARAVVRPADTGEVAAVLRACTRHRAPVVTQGGNTGLVGGGVPRGGEVVLSTRRLDSVAPVDAASVSVVAGAGATLAAVRDAARARDLDVGVDLAARDSATVGGMVATNAGGLHVARYGTMREQVLGLEAVLADGSVLGRVPGLRKDNTGWSWPALLAGSEGTLAVLTRVHLRLVPRLDDRVVALVAFDGFADALAFAARARAELPSLHALEVVFERGVDLVCDTLGLAPPFRRSYPVLLVVEVAGRAGSDPLLTELQPLLDEPVVRDAAVGVDARVRDALWQYRERQSEAVNRVGVPHKLDVTVPEARLGEFEARVHDAIAAVAPTARTYVFGHLGDGNLHVNVVGPGATDTRADRAVLELVAALGGSISAEHGIGVAKREFVALTRSPAEIAAIRAVRGALDPMGVLNPGVLI